MTTKELFYIDMELQNWRGTKARCADVKLLSQTRL